MASSRTDNDLAYVEAGTGGDLATMLVFNLLRTHGHLAPFVDAGLRGANLTAAQLNALLVLRSAGAEGLSMGEIGRRLVVTKSNVTGLVDRLERQGLAERLDGPDRRATPVRLTAEGAKTLRDAVPDQAAWLATLTDALGEREKRSLIRLLTKLRRSLRQRRREASP